MGYFKDGKYVSTGTKNPTPSKGPIESSQSSGSTSSPTTQELPASRVYITPEKSATGEGVWVDYATEKIVVDSSGKQRVEQRTTSIGTPSRIRTSGKYASPISNRQLTYEEQKQEIENFNYAQAIAEKSRNRTIIDLVNERVQGINILKSEKEPLQVSTVPSFTKTQTVTREGTSEFKAQQGMLTGQFEQTLSLAGYSQSDVRSMGFNEKMLLAQNFVPFKSDGMIGVGYLSKDKNEQKVGVVQGVDLSPPTGLVQGGVWQQYVGFIGAGGKEPTYQTFGTFTGTKKEISGQAWRGTLDNLYVMLASAGMIGAKAGPTGQPTSIYHQMVNTANLPPPQVKGDGLILSYDQTIPSQSEITARGTVMNRPITITPSGTKISTATGITTNPLSVTYSKGMLTDPNTMYGTYVSGSLKGVESGTFKSDLISRNVQMGNVIKGYGIDFNKLSVENLYTASYEIGDPIIASYYMGDVQTPKSTTYGSTVINLEPHRIMQTQTGGGAVARTELYKPSYNFPFTTQPIVYQTTAQDLSTGASSMQTGMYFDVSKMVSAPQSFDVSYKAPSYGGDFSWLKPPATVSKPPQYGPIQGGSGTQTGTATKTAPTSTTTFTTGQIASAKDFGVVVPTYAQSQPMALQMPFSQTDMRTGTFLSVEPSSITKPDVGQISGPKAGFIPRIDTSLKVEPIVVPTQISMPMFGQSRKVKQDIGQIQQVQTDVDFTPPTPSPTIVTPPVIPIGGGGGIAGLWWDTEFKGQKGTRGWKFKGKRPKAYTPSVTASAFKIKAPAQSINMKKMFSGLEVRPIPVFKKITKKRKKKKK